MVRLFTACMLYGRSNHGVMVIAIGNGQSDLSSNPRQGYLHFTTH